MTQTSPEIGKSVVAGGIVTNYHDLGSGRPVVFVHGSGPGVSAYANWRLALPVISQKRRCLALDMVGFGFTERPDNFVYSMDNWIAHLIGFLDALNVGQCDIVGNSFGGAVSLAAAIRYPNRFRRLALMGAVGVPFPITPGLDETWGYTPSIDNMRRLLDLFAFNRDLVTDDLAKIRYEASIRPGFQESYSAMFPAPRQRWVDAMASPVEHIRALPHTTLVIHGREDRIIPCEVGYRLFNLIPNAQLHMFGRCGHWTQIEHTTRFNTLIDDFLSEEG